MTDPKADQLLVLSAADVEACLPMEACIEAMKHAFVGVSSGEVHNPLRQAIIPPLDGAPGLFGLMPAIAAGSWTYGLKEVCIFPGNHALGVDSHQGSVLLHEGTTGRLVAVLNGSAITAIRTAAATAVASAELARNDATTMALVGAGIQARWHLEALSLVHDLTDIRVCSAHPESAKRFVETWSARYPVRAVGSVEEAVTDADIITTVTNAAAPIVERVWVADGVHINAVGSSQASKREIDGPTVGVARLFVDLRESANNEAGDYLLGQADGDVGANHIVAEIGELLSGQHPGRESTTEITMFKSLGLAIEDLMAAESAVARAGELGLGTTVAF